MERALLDPSRLQLLIWAAALGSYLVSFAELPSASVLAWVGLLAGCFSAGAALAIRVAQNSTAESRCERVVPGAAVRKAACVLFLAQVYYAYQTVLAAQAHGGLVSYLTAVRLAALGGEPIIEHYTVYLQVNTVQLVLLQFAIASTLLRGDSAEHRKLPYFMYGFTLLATLADGSRSVFITGLLSLLALHLAAGKLKATTLVWVLGITSAVFALTFTVFRADALDFDFGDLARIPLVYYSGSLGSMAPVLSGSMHIYWFDIESVSNKLSALGLPFPSFELAELRSDYVDLSRGHYTNVFSAFGLYYDYMGVAGSIAFVLIVGAICGFAFRLRRASPLGMTAYGLMWAAVVLMPFHDYFVGQVYTFVKLLFCLAIIQLASAGQPGTARADRVPDAQPPAS